MPRIVKVLLLDRFTPLKVEIPDVKIEIIDEENSLRNTSRYLAPERILVQISELTLENKVDVVILGNNEGVGLKKAEHIAPHMRENTIVVWHYKGKDAEKPYAELGIRHFSERQTMEVVLERVIRNLPQPVTQN